MSSHCHHGCTASRLTQQFSPQIRPQKIKLAYARLMILEASRHGHLGWLDYDRSFRQQAAANPSLPWNTLSPALHATTILGNFTGKPSRLLCSLCRGVDHTRNECALAYLHPKSHPPPPTFTHTGVTCVTRGIEVPASIPAHARTTMFVLHALVQHLILLANAPKHQATRSSSRRYHSVSLRKRIPLNS